MPDAERPETPEPEADERLLAARDLAVAALKEITPEKTIGAPAGHRVEADGVVSLLFATRLEGYPGWYWTVSLATVDDEAPTVLEAELLPGDGALLAPDWVPWGVRLAEYRAQQAAVEDPDGEGSDDESEDDDADDFDDEPEDAETGDDEFDEHDLHDHDDGIDIDDLDGASEDDESDDESDTGRD